MLRAVSITVAATLFAAGAAVALAVGHDARSGPMTAYGAAPSRTPAPAPAVASIVRAAVDADAAARHRGRAPDTPPIALAAPVPVRPDATLRAPDASARPVARMAAPVVAPARIAGAPAELTVRATFVWATGVYR